MKLKKSTLLLLLSGVALPASAYADAPHQKGTSQEVQEIIVTANKRSERATDVPLSLTAITGSSLARQGVASASDLEHVVPGFEYQPSSRQSPVYSIRGIGFYDTSFTNSPAVTVYLDQVSLPFLVMTEGVAFDLERVEVLKGPQGTLFGQNSTGGAVNYIAAKPTNQFAAGISTTYGRFNEIDNEAYVSGPLSNTLTARVAVRDETSDAWQHSYTRDDTNGARGFGTGRLVVDWTPSSDAKFELDVNGWLDKSQTQAGQDVAFTPTTPASSGGRTTLLTILQNYPKAPHDITSADWDPNESLRNNNWFIQGSLRGDIKLNDTTTFTSITAYSDYSSNSPIDSDGTDVQDIYLRSLGYARSFSQELRIAGSKNKLKWLIGGNAQFDRTLDNELVYSLGSNQTAAGLPFYGFSQHQEQNANTYAPFGSLEYQVMPAVTLRGSVRYTSQDRNADGCLSDVNGSLAATFSRVSSALSHSPVVIPEGGCVTLGNNLKPVSTVLGKLDQSNTSWKVGADWKPKKDVLLYANVARGYKAGGFDTLPAIRNTQLAPVPQETVLAYEVGFKMVLPNPRTTITGAAFYYDYNDKQLTGYINTGLPFGTLPGLVSIPKSSVRGTELDVTTRPIKGLSVTLGGTYVDSSIDQNFIASDPFGNTLNIKGESFPNTPKWQLLGSTEYTTTLENNSNWFMGGGFNYRSGTYAAFGQSSLFRLPSYPLINLHAGIDSPDGHWELMLWGKNVFNRRYLTSVNRPIDTVVEWTGMPATYGFTVSYKY